MITNAKRAILTLGLVVVVLAAGCSGGGLAGIGGGADGGNGGDGAESSGGGGSGGDGGSGGGGDGGLSGSFDSPGDDVPFPQIRQRQVIFTGRVVLEVDDFAAARGNLSDAVRAHGGFVSDARARLHRVDEQPYRTGVVVLRVPRENFSVLMTRVEAEGTVLSSETSSDDVTDQLVDIEARLSSLRAERERLRTLFARANDTEAVLAVEERLSEVQTEIERLAARKQSLSRQVALSTITVELREERPEVQAEQWYDVGVIAAFLDSVDGVVVTLRALAVGFAYALPYLVVFGVPLGAIGLVVRRRR